MTLPAQTPSITYSGDGITTSWAYPFEIPYQSDGVTPSCFVYTSTGGVSTVLVLGRDYSITNVGNMNGGTIITSAVVSSGSYITIKRNLNADQVLTFPNQGFLASNIEAGLDKVTMLIQDTLAEWGQDVIPVGANELWFNNPSGNLQGFSFGNHPGQLIAVDASGHLTTVAPPPPGGGGGGGGSEITGGGISVFTYDAIRQGNFQPATPGAPIAITLVDPYKGGIFIPGPTGLTDNGGTILIDGNGQSWVRVFSGRVSAAWFYNGPGHFLGDGSGLTITATDQANNPQWIGMPPTGATPYPVGTTWAYVALQEWLYAGFASASTPGNVSWNENSGRTNRALWCPSGNMNINQGLFFHATGVDIEFASRSASRINWQGPLNASAFAADAVSYGAIRNLTIYDQTIGSNAQLVDLNYSGTITGLATQQLTLYDWVIAGTGNTAVCIYISRSGGSAQGDTILLVNPLVTQCLTGLIAGGQNALSINVVEGNFQECYIDGIAVYGGTVFCYGTSFQNQNPDFWSFPQFTQQMMGGADFHVYGGAGGTAKNVLYAIRSESNVLVIDVVAQTTVRDSGMAGAGYFQWGANQHGNLGELITTGGLINTVAVLVDDTAPYWFLGDPTSTTTRAVYPGGAPSPPWTVNQWNGRPCWHRFGNGYTTANTIVSSDATSFSVAAGTPFPTSAAGHYMKISGATGSVAPNWDAAPPGHSAAPGPGPGYGFTTVAGSNIFSTNNTLSVGQYVVICNANPFGSPVTPGALIGKVGIVVDGTHYALMDGVGNPLNAPVSVNDAYGYWGNGIVDNQIVWLPLDFNTICGVQKADNVFLPVGRAQACGMLDLINLPQQNFIRSNENPVNYYGYKNEGQASLVPGGITAVASTTISLPQAQYATNLPVNVAIASVSLNMPVMNAATLRDFKLIFNSAFAGAIITWGTNVKAAAPTFTLGASGTTTVVSLTWIGNRGTGGSWYVTGIQGPM